MKCQYCGIELFTNQKVFCNQCGSDTTTQKKMNCRRCGRDYLISQHLYIHNDEWTKQHLFSLCDSCRDKECFHISHYGLNMEVKPKRMLRPQSQQSHTNTAVDAPDDGRASLSIERI